MTDTQQTEMELQLDLVRRNADSGRNFTQWRDVAICKARACGATIQQIAERAKLSTQGTRKVLIRMEAEKPVDNSVSSSTIET